jgi:hypothetical protein
MWGSGEHLGRNQLDESAVELWGLNERGVLGYLVSGMGEWSQLSTAAGSGVNVAGGKDEFQAGRRERSGFECAPSSLLRAGAECHQAAIAG